MAHELPTAEVAWLYSLQQLGVKLGLDNIRLLFEELGHPERAFSSVLVGGTNGKGSVAAMLHAMLLESGVEAGLFTSPHLVRPGERIRIGRQDIAGDELDRHLGRLRQRIVESLGRGRLTAHPSFFEVTTAAALEVFRDRRLRVAVLEVGLGGRLDATNAVEADLSVIVSIDLDHTKILGPTREHIAAEKAGIIKPGRPLVSGVVRQGAVNVLQSACRERGAHWIDALVAARFAGERGDEITLETERRRYPGLRLALAGRHQIHNARVALAAFEAFAERSGIEVSVAAVRRALATVRWPGRLQWVRDPAGGPRLLFDGAHNPAGAATLANYLATLQRPAPVALFAVMQGKLLDGIIESIGPALHGAVITRPSVERAADPHEVAAEVRRHVRCVEVVEDPARGLARARALAGEERFVLVTGSLYLVGEILELIGEERGPGPVSM